MAWLRKFGLPLGVGFLGAVLGGLLFLLAVTLYQDHARLQAHDLALQQIIQVINQSRQAPGPGAAK
jgi:uncharacterized integral membrane protein